MKQFGTIEKTEEGKKIHWAICDWWFSGARNFNKIRSIILSSMIFDKTSSFIKWFRI